MDICILLLLRPAKKTEWIHCYTSVLPRVNNPVCALSYTLGSIKSFSFVSYRYIYMYLYIISRTTPPTPEMRRQTEDTFVSNIKLPLYTCIHVYTLSKNGTVQLLHHWVCHSTSCMCMRVDSCQSAVSMSMSQT